MIQALLIKFLLPMILNAVFDALLSALRSLADKTDSDVDNKLVSVLEKESSNIKRDILEKVKK